MKNLKKTITLLLAMVMTVACMMITASAEDTAVKIAKTDEDANPLTGAKLQLILKSSSLVQKEWTSDADGEIFFDLVKNETYIVHEVTPADGYASAEDVEFVYEGIDGKTQGVTSVSSKTSIRVDKIDGNRTALAGANFVLKNKTTGQQITEWTSGITGKTIEKLIVGNDYTIMEIAAPEGYATATDVNFTMPDSTEPYVITISNKAITTVSLSKVNRQGEMITGANMQLIKDSDKSVIKDWVSGNGPYSVDGLFVGDVYILHEVTPAAGYATGKDVKFTVTNRENQSYVMIDLETSVKIIKTDAMGTGLKGAELQLLNAENGSEIKSWTTNGEGLLFSGLTVGKKYVIHEIKAPTGYAVAKDVSFIVKDTDEMQTQIMVDNKAGTSTVQNTQQTTVTSAKTYDEGIAIYVIMALCGISGIAVCIKLNKKKRQTKN